MGTTGCVGYLFTEKGLIIIDNEDGDIDEEKLMEEAMEVGAEDFQYNDGIFEIYTEPDDLYPVRDELEKLGYKIESAEPDMVPSNYITLDNEDDIKHMGLLLEALEENEDVQNVYHNWENCD
jgi:transcriptional/translational regulatory protein YebC/TACO1